MLRIRDLVDTVVRRTLALGICERRRCGKKSEYQVGEHKLHGFGRRDFGEVRSEQEIISIKSYRPMLLVEYEIELAWLPSIAIALVLTHISDSGHKHFG